ncbi:MAG: hypothetical protein GC136_02400 [Alphaproteobacteria bacterium]|nr:hypothetical protein [Alphaproteobacteria bacterium]
MDSVLFQSRLQLEETRGRHLLGQLDGHEGDTTNDQIFLAGRAQALMVLDMLHKNFSEHFPQETFTDRIDRMLNNATEIFSKHKDGMLRDDINHVFGGNPPVFTAQQFTTMEREFVKGFSNGLEASCQPGNEVQSGVVEFLDILGSEISKRYYEVGNWLMDHKDRADVDVSLRSYHYGLISALTLAREYVSEHMSATLKNTFPALSSDEEMEQFIAGAREKVCNDFISGTEVIYPSAEGDFSKARFSKIIETIQENAKQNTGLAYSQLSNADVEAGFLDGHIWLKEFFSGFPEMDVEKWTAYINRKYPLAIDPYGVGDVVEPAAVVAQVEEAAPETEATEGEEGPVLQANPDILYDHYNVSLKHQLYVDGKKLTAARKEVEIYEGTPLQKELKAAQNDFSYIAGQYIVTELLARRFDQFIEEEGAHLERDQDEMFNHAVDAEQMEDFLTAFTEETEEKINQIIEDSAEVLLERMGQKISPVIFSQGVHAKLEALKPFPLSPAHNFETSRLLAIYAAIQHSHPNFAEAVQEALPSKRGRVVKFDWHGLAYNVAFTKTLDEFAEALDKKISSFATMPEEDFNKQLFMSTSDFFNAEAIMDGKLEIDPDEAKEMDLSPAYYEILEEMEEMLATHFIDLDDTEEVNKNLPETLDHLVNETIFSLNDDYQMPAAQMPDENIMLEGVRDAVLWLQANWVRINMGEDLVPAHPFGMLKAGKKDAAAPPLQRYIM